MWSLRHFLKHWSPPNPDPDHERVLRPVPNLPVSTQCDPGEENEGVQQGDTPGQLACL